MIRRLSAAVATAALLLVFTPAGRAAAHAALDISFPTANAVLESSPPSILLDFDEDIDRSLASIQLFDRAEQEIPLGPLTQVTDASTVQTAVPTLEDGTYVVVWRVASADGHVVDGAFSFQVGTASQPPADDLIERVSGAASASAAVGWMYGIARFLALLGIVVMVGAGVFAIVGPARELLRSTIWLLRVGVAALILGTIGSIGFYGSKAVAGGVSDAFSPDVWGQIIDTHVARTLLVRLAFALVMVALLVTVRHRTQGWWQGAGLASLVLSLVTFSAAGHAYAQQSALPWIANDAIHLGAAGLWFGGLVLFVSGGRAWFDDADRAPVVAIFSRVSVVAVPVVVLTGVVQTIKIGGGLDVVRAGLTDTGWGRTLLVKVAVVAIAVAIGGVSHWLVRNDGVHGVRRTVMAEAVIGLTVIGLAAGLVGLPPEAATPAQTYTTTLAQGDVLADITFTPGSVGGNELHIVVTTPGGNLSPITDLGARMTPVSGALPTSPVSITEDGANHYTGRIVLPVSGDWTLEIIIQVDPSRSVLLSTTVPIPG